MTDSLFLTNLVADVPLVMDANYRFGPSDRQYIDSQVRQLQKALIDGLIKGRQGSYFTLDTGSGAASTGQVVCLASTATGSVTLATSAALGNAKIATGVVISAASPGAKVYVVFEGILPPDITGLATSAAGYVRVKTSTQTVERVASLGPSDYSMGTVDSGGYMQVGTRVRPVNTSALALTADFTTTLATAVATNLTFTINVGETWVVEVSGVISSQDTNGVAVGFTLPTGATIAGDVFGHNTSATSYTDSRLTAAGLGTAFSASTGTLLRFNVFATITADSTHAGAVTFVAASVTAGQTCTIKAGALLRATRTDLV